MIHTCTIIPVSKQLVTFIYKSFRPCGREQSQLGDFLSTVAVFGYIYGWFLW